MATANQWKGRRAWRISGKVAGTLLAPSPRHTECACYFRPYSLPQPNNFGSLTLHGFFSQVLKSPASLKLGRPYRIFVLLGCLAWFDGSFFGGFAEVLGV
jgi:hypothetical protein